MLKIDKITAHNFLFWKKLDFTLESGITCIRGLNGSGKTLMWKALDHALGIEVGKRGTSENKLPAASSVGVTLRAGKRTVDLKLTPSTLSVTENGKDTGLRGKTAPRTYVTEMFDMPRDLYESTVHLSGTSNHPLTTGTAGTRLKWIGDVLGINRPYDELLRQAESRYRKVKDSHVLLQAAKESLAGTPRTQEPMPVAELKAEWDQASKRVLEAFEELERRDQVKRLSKKIVLNYDVAELERLLGVTKKAIKRYRAVEVEQSAYEKARKAHKRTRERLKDAENALAALPTVKGKLKALKQAESQLMSEYETLRPTAEEWEEQADARKRLSKLNRPSLKKKQVADKLASAKSQREQREEELEALEAVDQHNHKGGSCPTCGSKLNLKAFKKLIDQAKSDIAGHDATIKRLRKQSEYYELQDQITVEANPVPKLEQVMAEIKTLRKSIKALDERKQLERTIEELKASLSDLPAAPPTPVDDMGNPVKDLAKKLDELEEQRDTLTSDIQLRAQVDDVYRQFKQLEDRPFVKHTNKELKLVLEQFKLLADEHEKLYLENIRIDAIYKETEAKRVKLKAQVKGLKKQAKQADHLRLLCEYAGPRGARITKIRERMHAFVNELNRLAPKMWNRKFVFDSEVTADGLTLYVERNGLRSDMTSLSGGETKCWRALCALALVQMLPQELRCDTIILDEIEANLDADARYKYARDFIPALQAIVPKVLIVTPMADQEVPIVADRHYEVKMENGVSRVHSLEQVLTDRAAA